MNDLTQKLIKCIKDNNKTEFEAILKDNVKKELFKTPAFIQKVNEIEYYKKEKEKLANLNKNI